MSRHKAVILYLDDDPDYLATIGAIIESAGYEVVLAKSAEEGLRVYREAKPDLVLVDLMMEEVDAGITFVKEVRALDHTSPIYLLSSLGDTLTLTTDVEQLGLSGVLQKPLEPATLIALLKTRLDPASN